MSSTDGPPPSPSPDRPGWPPLIRKTAIWAPFLAFCYLMRDFLVLGLMTFVFCFVTLAVVRWGMRWFSPGRERPWLRRLLTAAVYVVIPLVLVELGSLVTPRLLEQGQHLAGWLSRANAESEAARVLEYFIGPYLFAQAYRNPRDPNYQRSLEAFRASDERYGKAYDAFPTLEAWVEDEFHQQFGNAEAARIRDRLAREGTSSQEFEQWFLTEKLPRLQAQARQHLPEDRRESASLLRLAASAKPDEWLRQARRDLPTLTAWKQEWFTDTLDRDLVTAKASPAYQEQFREYYEKRRRAAPDSLPYTFEQYLELQKARPQGRRAFSQVLQAQSPSMQEDGEARLEADFRAERQHELFQEWWNTSAAAQFIRHRIEAGISINSDVAVWVEQWIAAFLHMPIDLGTALLLSFFICIDYPELKRGMLRIRETWLREAFNEITGVLARLATLVGRSMRAQGIIALCNATMMFFALTFLGLEHAAVLSLAVFVLCLIPTLGAVIAWVLVAAFALFQPGGGPVLALKVSVAMAFVLLMESLVLSPRILGRMMELHPALIIAILPVAQYFFGVWGLILATPVTVYVVYVLILRRDLPGVEVSDGPEEARHAP